MTTTTTFQVGASTTAQLGNISDTSGYQANAPVKVIAVQDRKFVGNRFLIEIEPGFIGDAGVYPEPELIKGELYCTSARRFGEHEMFKTFESAARSLGF